MKTLVPRSFSLTDEDIQLLKEIQKYLKKEQGAATLTGALRYSLRQTVAQIKAAPANRGGGR